MVNQVNNNFLKSSHHIINLELCSVRLIDNQKFPWIILIPKRKHITDISELNSKDQLLLMKEIVYCSNLMKKVFKTSRLNVEKLEILCLNYIFILLQEIKMIVHGLYLYG